MAGESFLCWVLLAFAYGYLTAWWSYRHLYAKNLALRLEIIGMRNRIHPGKTNNGTLNKILPKMSRWSKVVLGFLRRFLPDAVSWNQFSPKTLDSWAQALTQPSTYIKALKSIARMNKHRKDTNKAKKRGRLATPQYLVDIILCIKKFAQDTDQE